MYRVVDLFAGCGGLSKGFEDGGFDVVAAVENWDPAIECYKANFNHPVLKQDLGDVESSVELIKGYSPDIIIGGPPCQDFSHAGKRVEASRASLTDSYAQIIASIKPRYFVMENVERARNSNAYAEARKIFKDAGYGITERVLTASYCGVPQRRKRFFCVGILGESDGFLDETLTANLSEKEMTVRDYLGDSLDTEYYYRHPRNYSRRAIYSIDEPAPTMRGVNRPIPKGYPGHPKDACKVDDNVRPLTTLERSLIQTFPADFKWTGSKTDREQMIGNAVPVNLGRFVARALLQYLEPAPIALSNEVLVEFKSWLEDCSGLSARSASSAVSRLVRANEILPICKMDNMGYYIAELNETKSFCELAPSVKSQLRGAVKRYVEFCRSVGLAA